MRPQTPGRDQRNELNPTWPRNSQPHMDSGSASGTLSSWGADPFAEQTLAGYHTVIPGTHHQYSSTLARHLVSSSYEPADTGSHLSLPPLHVHHHAHHQVEFAGFPNNQDGSNRHSSVAGALPTTATSAAEGRQAASLGVAPNMSAPKIPVAQRKIRARQPAPDEWERHKRTIELLYLEKNHSLAETITEMSATHQFYAT